MKKTITEARPTKAGEPGNFFATVEFMEDPLVGSRELNDIQQQLHYVGLEFAIKRQDLLRFITVVQRTTGSVSNPKDETFYVVTLYLQLKQLPIRPKWMKIVQDSIDLREAIRRIFDVLRPE